MRDSTKAISASAASRATGEVPVESRPSPPIHPDDRRTNLDHLRVEANLGRKEARDKLREFEQQLSPAFKKAKRHLDEVRTLGRSRLAGWDELRRTHRELSRAADIERSETHKGTGA